MSESIILCANVSEFLLLRVFVYDPFASIVGKKSASALPRNARAARTRASDAFRSKFDFTARSTNESSCGSPNVRHHRISLAGLFVVPPELPSVQLPGIATFDAW